jgi:hypothetical protein
MTPEELEREANANAIREGRANETDWRPYYVDYAKKVREEAIRTFAERIFNRGSAARPQAADLEQAANRWLASVKLHDKWGEKRLFNDKPRGHGQGDGSTDGRLLRKLIKKVTTQPIAEDDTDEGRSSEFNSHTADTLKGVLSQPGGSFALKKALFLTREKMSDPLGYKEKYARRIPFGQDVYGNTKWVKASRRFYTPANIELPLPPRQSDGSPRTITPVTMGQPPDGLNPFNPDSKELIEDVGQKHLGECWLQSAATSLPRYELERMFSWVTPYESEGVTTRLYEHDDGRVTPIYIRTPKDRLWDANPHLAARVFAHKAQWPAALVSAVAKIGRQDLRDYRRSLDFIPRDPNTGMPLYSVRDVYGNTLEAAAKLLTGQNPLIDIDLSGKSPSEKQKISSQAWQNLHSLENGVATFANFNDPNGSDYGRNHAVTSFGPINSSKWQFGNTWPEGDGETSLNQRRKIFSADIARAKRIGALNSNIAHREIYISGPRVGGSIVHSRLPQNPRPLVGGTGQPPIPGPFPRPLVGGTGQHPIPRAFPRAFSRALVGGTGQPPILRPSLRLPVGSTLFNT